MVFPHSGADRSIEPSWSRLFLDAVSAPGLPHLPGASQLILELLRARQEGALATQKKQHRWAEVTLFQSLGSVGKGLCDP